MDESKQAYFGPQLHDYIRRYHQQQKKRKKKNVLPMMSKTYWKKDTVGSCCSQVLCTCARALFDRQVLTIALLAWCWHTQFFIEEGMKRNLRGHCEAGLGLQTLGWVWKVERLASWKPLSSGHYKDIVQPLPYTGTIYQGNCTLSLSQQGLESSTLLWAGRAFICLSQSSVHW